MIALVDGDIVAYVNAASAESDPLEIALLRADKQMRKILDYLNVSSYKVFVSGGQNFRYEINPNYKANRADIPSPIHRKACHQFLIDEWKAEETDGYEADDALGCFQREDTIICSLDKDLLMIPGRHYSWPITRHGKVIRDHIVQTVSYIDGIKHLYKQSLIGDTADNIFGVERIGKAKAAKIIDPLTTETDMYRIALSHYVDEVIKNNMDKDTDVYTLKNQVESAKDRFIMNLDCLWIWRQMGITWTIRSEELVNG